MSKRILAFFLALLFLIPAAPVRRAYAAGDDVSIVRDAEMEAAIKMMARPIWIAAGLKPDDVSIALVEDPRINAFVAGGQNIFLNTGLIIETRNVGELLGVIAHETGHIAGGHLLRAGEAMDNASYQAILAMVLGGLAAAASRDGGAIAGAIGGGQEIGARAFMAFSRGQESAADQAAVRFLQGAKMPADGLVTFFEKLQSQEVLPSTRQVEYVRTHPLTRDRIEAVRYQAERSPFKGQQFPVEMQIAYHRVKAKLLAWAQPGFALRRFGRGETTVDGRYARAIALFRAGNLTESLKVIDGLIAEKPNEVWFYEFKGQALFENGRVLEAAQVLRKASDLAPNEGLIRMASGQALVEANKPELLDAAIKDLKAAAIKERNVPLVHRLLATAYGRKGDEVTAKLELAEESALEGRIVEARRLAEQVLTRVPPGSRQAIQAQDILASTKPLDPAVLERMERMEREGRRRRGL
ncbi:M48 family metalloprotease [Roseiterribacter gracilis]|uniref:Peptidase M48 n=1 Tax=Roseiterribacter gracilis TaxID=2812848 RepID=A0A8S8XC10_9PROT|nr:peptidase M48 [Rhodospirillales bacterium TMPK1]